jgi:hypothetical protein
MSVTDDCMGALFVQCVKSLKLSSDSSDSSDKNTKNSVVWPIVECAFIGTLKSGGPFCVEAFDLNLVSVAMNVFSYLV